MDGQPQIWYVFLLHDEMIDCVRQTCDLLSATTVLGLSDRQSVLSLNGEYRR